MSSETLQNIASIVGIVEAIFFIISVFFIWLQIRERNRLTRVANTQALVELTSPYLTLLAQDREAAGLWVNGAKNYDTMDEVDRFRYIQLLAGWLIIHENVFYQHQNGLLDQKIYQSWEVQLQDFIRQRKIGLLWEKEFKAFFQTDFQKQVEGILAAPTHNR
jgi:hypothetical protein